MSDFRQRLSKLEQRLDALEQAISLTLGLMKEATGGTHMVDQILTLGGQTVAARIDHQGYWVVHGEGDDAEL